MENGSKVVYTLSDLKNITDNVNGKISVWAVQNIIHDGHRYCYNKARANGDFVVGMYWNNVVDFYKTFFGNVVGKVVPVYEDTLDEMSSISDATLLLTGDYSLLDDSSLSIPELWDKIKRELPDKFIPEFLHDDKQFPIVSLRSNMASLIMIQEFVHYDYYVGCIKDAYRYLLADWFNKAYTLSKYELVDPVLDKYGNNLAAHKLRLPKELQERIKKQLLKPEMRSISEVKKNISDIKDLNCVDFHYNPEIEWIYAIFQFGSNHQTWWNEGMKAK